MPALSDVPACFSSTRLALVHGAARRTFGDRDARSADPALTLAALRPLLTDYLAREKWPRALTARSTPVRDEAGKFRKARPKADA